MRLENSNNRRLRFKRNVTRDFVVTRRNEVYYFNG